MPIIGLSPDLTDPCIHVNRSGIYTVVSQLTFKKSSRHVSHFIYVKDGPIEEVIRRWTDVISSLKSNILSQHVQLKSSAQICVSARPTEVIYNSELENMLDIALHIVPENGTVV